MRKMFNNRNNKIIVIAAITILGLIGLFAFSNFKITRSRTSADTKSSKYEFGDPKIELDILYLYVEGNSRFANNLESKLEIIMISKGIDVILTEELVEKYDNQVLAVLISEKDIGYNPLIPSAEMEILFAYFLNGNTSYLEEIRLGEPLVISFTEEGLIKEGKILISDQTQGLVSYRAYVKYLANYSANQIYNQLPEN
ncbi:hypothetical protein GF319_10090 [Candidatus Bathyarchaeota archaeon]|jgi:hypothetical protein|nr:hypothetical protein [Candidatus Bathyarchaeota archaeon]